MKIVEPSAKILWATPSAEKMIEAAGRTCYKSEPKVFADCENCKGTGKVMIWTNYERGEDSGPETHQQEVLCSKCLDRSTKEFIQKILKNGHHSVLEHASATFRISEVSRSFSHQIVRQRLASFCQQSQRYVKEDQFGYVIPPAVYELAGKPQHANTDVDFAALYKEDMKKIQHMYDFWKDMGLKNEDARFVLPNACHTELVMTANFREWRHIFELRCDKHTQWEIRYASMIMLICLEHECPNVFGDLLIKFLNCE
jgi:thymidylate synthase (FAD)